jgi:hypothetical protein
MLPRSDDPLPANTIRFSEAFELFYQSTEPRWQEIDARIVATSDRLNEAPPEPVELTADGRLPFLGTGTLTDRHRLWVVEDFVCPDDPWQPGPMAAIDGFLRPLFFFRDVFEAQPKRLTQPAEQKRRGKKPIYDRACIQEIVFEKMDYHGEFDVADPDWKCQADLERAVLAELGDKGIAPAESTIRELIAKPLKDWRTSRASQGR